VNDLRLSSLEFGSLLSYSPRGTSDAEKQSRTAMRNLKDDQVVPNSNILMSDYISELIKKKMVALPFAHFLEINPILIPVPNSTLMNPGTLWVPKRLAHALVRNGFGKAIVECLKRVKPLPKAARSLASDRPKAVQHYESIEVQSMLSEPNEILMIDDIVTRGATMLGAANKLQDAFPNARIRAFAAIRTISPPDVFNAVYSPCKGIITLVGQNSFREP
jgi:predicted amidophosphoribosyltransferase